MNRKKIGVILIVIGALLALTVGVVVYMQVEQAGEIAKRTPTVDVVVALVDLPERVAVPEPAVRIAKVPADVVPLEAATRTKDVAGKYPLTKIYKSEVVVLPKLADTAGKTGPAFTLKEGMVAMSWKGPDELVNAGAIRAGDRVDLLLTLPLARPTTGGQAGVTVPQVTQTTLQNLEVLRVGPFPAAPGVEATSKGITFQVSHQDAVVLKWLKDSGGTIDLILRHPADTEPVSTEAITASYVYRKFRFALAEPIQ